MSVHARILSLVLALAACGPGSPAPPPDVEPLPGPGERVVIQPEVADIRGAAELRHATSLPSIAEMSLRDKAAQLVMPWIDGAYWADDNEAMEAALRLVEEQRVGGFVMGIGTSPYDVAAKLNRLQRASRLPLLMAADLESGPSMRIRGGTTFPGNMALGATGRVDDAYDVGRVIATEGRAVGFHMAFAPVVDVNNNPANPIINTRSFGEDPVQVGRLAAAFIRGLHDHGMLATAKHFPGHGDTGTDSHVALPVITVSRGRLDSLELVPFRVAVEAGVDAVMSAHIA
ncbi:MAG TPA: glycoside hydrolase family 3 N-terminal domain-containing protein, partial [Gemmatimonadales bacterium]|nr:glycoside hydrolase family 3 N-terminal domain-containing protein [Gemmatimonadales bacterium]